MDNDIINIYANDIEIAQDLCSTISDGNARSRAVANVLAVKLAERYFSSGNYEIDTATGLHNIPNVLENIDIADIYLNGAYIDVRVYFSEDEISVPKLHFDLGMTPILYMFIKLEQDLSSYKVAGFIRPEYINKDNLDGEYYYVNENDLSSFYDIESHLTTVYDTFNGSNELLYSFVDGSMDESGIAELLKVLIASANARAILIKAFKANSVFKFVSVSDTDAPVVTEVQPVDSEPKVTVQENDNNSDLTENELDGLFNEEPQEKEITEEDDLYNALEYSTEVTPNENITEDNDEAVSDAENQNGEQIEALFTGEQEGVPTGNNNKKKTSPTLIILIVALIGAIGFYAYSRTARQNEDDAFSQNTLPPVGNEEVIPDASSTKPVADAMPNETVDVTNNAPAQTEQAAPIVIPAIEQHLDASVLVSNLKVNWEVPAGYASNTAAKRYLVKLGKVIQLNLKSELLLLSKPPISNKISVELTYNSNSGKFEIVGIKDSSGEKSVDKVILDTIKSALELSSNTGSFGKLQGNPVLIINL